MRLLIIGSVHLDIVGEIKSGAENIDKIGELRLSVGGTAFNVAANLAYHGDTAALLSAVRPKSFGEVLIERELRRRHIKRDFMVKATYLAESGFVAHTRNMQLISAVSCIGIEQLAFTDDRLIPALKWAHRVAIDANLARNTLQYIAAQCYQQEIPLYGCCVSESKVGRLHKLFEDQHLYFDTILMNRAEALKVGFSLDSLIRDETLQMRLLSEFSASCIVVTDGNYGYHIFARTGGYVSVPGVEISNAASTLGAGDALFASIVAKPTEMNWQRHAQVASDYLLPAIRSYSAVPEVSERSGGINVSRLFGGYSFPVSALLVAIGVAVFGKFGPVKSELLIAIMYFCLSGLSGAAGSLLESKRKLDAGSDPARSCGLGLAAGLLAALLLAIPYFTAADSPTEISLLRNLLLSGMVVAFVAGMTFDSFLGRVAAGVEVPARLAAQSSSTPLNQSQANQQ